MIIWIIIFISLLLIDFYHLKILLVIDNYSKLPIQVLILTKQTFFINHHIRTRYKGNAAHSMLNHMFYVAIRSVLQAASGGPQRRALVLRRSSFPANSGGRARCTDGVRPGPGRRAVPSLPLNDLDAHRIRGGSTHMACRTSPLLLLVRPL